MVTLDTNAWVRYLTNDDELQARRAMKLLGKSRTDLFNSSCRGLVL